MMDVSVLLCATASVESSLQPRTELALLSSLFSLIVPLSVVATPQRIKTAEATTVSKIEPCTHQSTSVTSAGVVYSGLSWIGHWCCLSSLAGGGPTRRFMVFFSLVFNFFI